MTSASWNENNIGIDIGIDIGLFLTYNVSVQRRQWTRYETIQTIGGNTDEILYL